MVASAFLPVAIHRGQLLFLFGKEHTTDSAPGWSDFGGGVKDNEDIYLAGLREFSEETTGFLGDDKELGKLVDKNGGVYPIVHGDYHIHIFRLDYDPMLPEYYNRSNKFVMSRMNHTVLKKSMIFEKAEMKWMTIGEMRRRRREFRHFYRVILDEILKEVPQIRSFILGTIPKKHRRTLRKET
jgi:8-oxo-dGTP pyrophosphatase MutT (NUDIX family)